MWNIGAGVCFQALNRVGFGLAYRYFEIDGNVDTSGWYGDVLLTQDGPFLSLDVNW